MKRLESKQNFIDYAKREYGQYRTEITRKEVKALMSKYGLRHPAWLIDNPQMVVARGTYRLELPPASKLFTLGDDHGSADQTALERIQHSTEARPVQLQRVTDTFESVESAKVSSEDDVSALIPQKFRGYVPFGHYDDLKSIIASQIFYPVWVVGESGNGKSLQFKQICAELNRPYIRVQITKETTEDHLLGGYRLVNGSMVWQDGPVVIAYRVGCPILLDEVDRNDNLSCLMPVLEGEPIYLQKTNELVYPKDGFNVFATANTNGRGVTGASTSVTRYTATAVLDEAFIERFAMTFEQPWPPVTVEKKILRLALANIGVGDAEEFVDRLVTWANMTRTAYENGGAQEVISTRRLVHVCKAFAIFKSRRKAIERCVSRFDRLTQNTFVDLYKSLDPNFEPEEVK
jgi:MoxR-like ATPase